MTVVPFRPTSQDPHHAAALGNTMNRALYFEVVAAEDGGLSVSVMSQEEYLFGIHPQGSTVRRQSFWNQERR